VRPDTVRTLIVTALVSLVLAAPTAVPSYAATAAQHHAGDGRVAAERATGQHARHHAKHQHRNAKHKTRHKHRHGRTRHKHRHGHTKHKQRHGHTKHKQRHGHTTHKHRHGHTKHQHRHRHEERHKNRHRSSRPRLTIGTYNLRAGMGMRKFRNGVTSLRRHVGVAGLQEIGSNRRRHYLTSLQGWGYYRPHYIQQNPVIWDRDRFRLVRAHGDRIARSRHLRGQLPGATRRKKDSTATVVRLRHLASGRRISVVNVHLVHGAVKGGKPWPHRPAVFNLFRNQVAGLVDTVRRERRFGRVFVTGDFNVGYRADQHFALPRLPYRRLTRQRLNAVWHGTGYLRRGEGTHSDALIDQIWSGRGPTRVRILRWVRPSDHFPVVATYRIPRASRRG